MQHGEIEITDEDSAHEQPEVAKSADSQTAPVVGSPDNGLQGSSSSSLGRQRSRKSICFSPNLVDVMNSENLGRGLSPDAPGASRPRARSVCVSGGEKRQEIRKRKDGHNAGPKKPAKPVAPQASEEENLKKDTKNAPTTPTGRKGPEWYEELSDGQINMFKDVFELLDRDGGGSLDANELHNVMQEMDIDVALEEIEAVLNDLDKDGNGEIDFDEFLYTMCETTRYIEILSSDPQKAQELDESGSYSRRQRLFFTAITRFAIKNSMGDIERYYANKMRQAPHVISFYTAGVRLIGLNDRQLELRLRKMQKEARGHDSPYAKPLPFVTVKPRKKKPPKPKPVPAALPKEEPEVRLEATTPQQMPWRDIASRRNTSPATDLEYRHIQEGHNLQPSDTAIGEWKPFTNHDAETKTSDISPASELHFRNIREGLNLQPMDSTIGELKSFTNRDDETKTSPDSVKQFPRRRSAITPDSPELLEVMKLLQDLAKQGSVVAKLPDVHLVPDLRKRLVQITADGVPQDPMCSSVRRRRKTMPEFSTMHSSNPMYQTQSGHLRKASKSLQKGDHVHSPVADLGKGKAKSKPRGWVIPRIERGHAALPVIPFSGAHEKLFTIEDVPVIRERVSKALDKYYSSLRKAHVHSAWQHWGKLQTGSISSEKLRKNFKQVYCAYSPHKEQDVFVITPWIPGPRYTSRQPGKPQGQASFGQTSNTGPRSATPQCRPVSRASRPNSVCV